MKRIIFSLIFIVPFFICSCVMGPDDMIKAYNDQMYEDIGGGMYQKGDVIINPYLIEKDVFPVKAGGTLRLEISAAYYSYSWTLEDNSTDREWNIPGYYIVYVGRPDIELIKGHRYTLTVTLKNRNGVIYTDSATISVV